MSSEGHQQWEPVLRRLSLLFSQVAVVAIVYVIATSESGLYSNATQYSSICRLLKGYIFIKVHFWTSLDSPDAEDVHMWWNSHTSESARQYFNHIQLWFIMDYILNKHFSYIYWRRFLICSCALLVVFGLQTQSYPYYDTSSSFQWNLDKPWRNIESTWFWSDTALWVKLKKSLGFNQALGCVGSHWKWYFVLFIFTFVLNFGRYGYLAWSYILSPSYSVSICSIFFRCFWMISSL